MLTEERYEKILSLINKKRAVTVTELTDYLNTSESTIRRDLNALSDMGRLHKVHGGATALAQNTPATVEEDVSTKSNYNVAAKETIAKYAASVVNNDDFVFIDAGTTTARIIDYLPADITATFVTNGVVHAKKLIQKGFKAYIIGGQLKLSTEAVIGVEAVNNLRKYNFTKCFMGTNGIDLNCGFSTPDTEEALVKQEAVRRSFISYVLADSSKFGVVSSVSFGEITDACIVSEKMPDTKYSEAAVIKVAAN